MICVAIRPHASCLRWTLSIKCFIRVLLRYSLGKLCGSRKFLTRLVSFFERQLWEKFLQWITSENSGGWSLIGAVCVNGMEKLLISFSFRDLWDLVFSIFGVDWVMPRWVMELLVLYGVWFHTASCGACGEKGMFRPLRGVKGQFTIWKS